MASSDAFLARLTDDSLPLTKRLFFIPVREVIHSSDVSTIFDRSSFEITVSGAYAPIPTILTAFILISHYCESNFSYFAHTNNFGSNIMLYRFHTNTNSVFY